jgi:uncharacterized membrane protein YfcA
MSKNIFNRTGKKVDFAIIGAVLGIPLSYYFQNEMIKNIVGGISGYLDRLDKIVDNENLLTNLLVSILVFSFIGGLIGYLIDKSEINTKS